MFNFKLFDQSIGKLKDFNFKFFEFFKTKYLLII